jgi:hypothetical protein
VDEALGRQFQAYLDGGGAIIASYNALRIAGTDRIWAADLDLTYAGESPFKPVYLKLGSTLSAELPDYEFALYDGAAQWQPAAGHADVTLATLAEPLFQRSPAHYTSHGQTPVDRVTGYAAVVRQERLAATAFPLGTSYYRHGYWIYRAIFAQLLDAVLPVRLTSTNAPLSTEVTVTHQVEQGDRPERWMVHVVNFSPNRRGPEHPEYIEDPIPLHDVEVNLAVGAVIRRAYLAADGTELSLDRAAHGWSVTIPRVEFGAIAVLEAARASQR